MEPRVDELDDVLQFMRELWAVVHALQRTSKRMEQRSGVTGPQRLVLRVVGLFPGSRPVRSRALLHVHPSTLTGILRRLGTQGLLTREASAGDRRRAVLRLTAAGRRVNARRAGTVEAAVGRLLRKLGARERVVTDAPSGCSPRNSAEPRLSPRAGSPVAAARARRRRPPEAGRVRPAPPARTHRLALSSPCYDALRSKECEP